MAMYGNSKYLVQAALEEFGKTYSPGTIGTYSGIYRCDACGHEVVHTREKPLPPQNHHQHAPGLGSIRWRLIVTDYAIAA